MLRCNDIERNQDLIRSLCRKYNIDAYKICLGGNPCVLITIYGREYRLSVNENGLITREHRNIADRKFRYHVEYQGTATWNKAIKNVYERHNPNQLSGVSWIDELLKKSKQ